jgi:hypothetical protein
MEQKEKHAENNDRQKIGSADVFFGLSIVVMGNRLRQFISQSVAKSDIEKSEPA